MNIATKTQPILLNYHTEKYTHEKGFLMRMVSTKVNGSWYCREGYAITHIFRRNSRNHFEI
jgi:hypothetical protein